MNGSIAKALAAVIALALAGPAAAGTLKDCDRVARTGDGAAAIQCLQPLAEAGDGRAEGQLGFQYGVVNAPTYDPEKSAFWTKKAAEHGDIEAQVMVAGMYRQGQGAPKDLVEALRWYRVAADRGDQNAQLEVGRMYYKGWGTPKDVAQAIIWCRKAAERGGPTAMLAEASIASFYLNGDGVLRDDVEAARWFRRAAKHGSPSAHISLAQLDEKGLGVRADPFEAYVGYSIGLAWLQNQRGPGAGARLDDAMGRIAERRAIVAAQLTDSKKAKADRLVSQFKGH